MKTLMKLILLLAVVLSVACHGFAQLSDSTRSRRQYLPHFIPVQSAGNIGFLSVGIGYSTRTRNYHVSLLYGYVPKSVARTYIQTIALKNIFPIARFALKNDHVLVPYVGLGASFELGGNSFFRQPAHFPKDYYDFPKNIHALVYGGAKVQRFFEDPFIGVRGLEFFVEAGTIDLYIWYKTMSQQMKLKEVFTLATGVNLLLSR